MKKIIAMLLCLAMALSLVACGGSSAPAATEAPKADAPATNAPTAEAPTAEPVTIKVAAIETAYGSQVWVDVAAAFEAETGIKVELTTDKNLEDVLSGPMQNGEFPDVVHLATGRPAGLTEQLVKANALHPLTNALALTIPGESVKVSDKIAGGFTDNNIVAPYGDGVTYMAPMFYSPCGLFYNAKLFEDKGWEVPTTWDEMWELGETAKAEGIYLFTYPTAGYYDAFMFALMNAIGGPDFFNAITTYQEGAWDSENGKTLLNILDKLASYTHPSTPAQANNQDFTKNQQMAMNGSALFMPNGTWITSEMADYAATLDNFAWGMTAVPAAGTAPYSFCWFERLGSPLALSTLLRLSSSLLSCTPTRLLRSLLPLVLCSPSWASPTCWKARMPCSTPSTTTVRRLLWVASPPSAKSPALMFPAPSLLPSTPWSPVPSPSTTTQSWSRPTPI